MLQKRQDQGFKMHLRAQISKQDALELAGNNFTFCYTVLLGGLFIYLFIWYTVILNSLSHEHLPRMSSQGWMQEMGVGSGRGWYRHGHGG